MKAEERGEELREDERMEKTQQWQGEETLGGNRREGRLN